MILILTTEAGDFSHPKFIDWLEYYKADYEILTGESIYRGETKVHIESNFLFVNGRNYTTDVNVVFNRRWLTASELPKIVDDKVLNKNMKNTLSSELYEIRDFLDYNLKNAYWIPKLKNASVNKITILQKAQEIGLLIPQFIITNQKEELLKFHSSHENIITKAIGNFPRNQSSDNFLINPIYTKIVKEELIDSLPNSFFMSIFQEYIPKKREYRVLYFDGKCFTVEILSQENNYSMVDSRSQENEDSEVRLQRTNLPSSYEEKIDDFMKSIDLNIGCLDILESINGELFFLEVNPVGQISGYSLRGNLNFEKEIVQQMIGLDEEIRETKRSK